jgi:hypothetical protein
VSGHPNPTRRQRIVAALECLRGRSVVFNVALRRVEADAKVLEVELLTENVCVFAVNEVPRS